MHDIRRKVKIGGGTSSTNEGVLNRKKVEFPPGFTFGQPHRPSTPIHEVLEHRYLHEWLNEAERAEVERVNAIREQSVGFLLLINLMYFRLYLGFLKKMNRKRLQGPTTLNQVG